MSEGKYIITLVILDTAIVTCLWQKNKTALKLQPDQYSNGRHCCSVAFVPLQSCPVVLMCILFWHSPQLIRKRVTASLGRKAYVSAIWERDADRDREGEREREDVQTVFLVSEGTDDKEPLTCIKIVSGQSCMSFISICHVYCFHNS